jgi:RND family efflux transporter MFP subunit
LEPSVGASLELEQAKRALSSAKSQRDLVRQRVQMKLATQQDLLGVEQSLKEAETRLASLENRGIDGARVLKAGATGVVGRIAVEPGQIVAAGDLLLTTIGEDRISVQLGIESEDVGRLPPREDVRLEPVGGPAGTIYSGTIDLITRRVNPNTRLVDVYVAPAKGVRLLLGEWMRAEIVIAAKEVLAVPLDAVLPEEGEPVLYTVEKGKAVRHAVDVGLRNDAWVEVRADDLAEGASVVVSGNAELEDGMSVGVGAGR